MSEPADPTLELAWLVAAGPGAADLQVDPDGAVTARQGGADESSDEIWFSADELARTSEIELGRGASEPGGLVPPLDPRAAISRIGAASRLVPAGLVLERFSPAALAALAGVGPGRVIQVRSTSAALAADFVESFTDAMVLHPSAAAAALVVNRRAIEEMAVAFAARRLGVPKAQLLQGPQHPGLDQLSEAVAARAERWRCVQLRQGPDAESPILAIAEALRVWARRMGASAVAADTEANACEPGVLGARMPLVAVPWPHEVFGGGNFSSSVEGLQQLRRSASDHGAVVMWAGLTGEHATQAADPRDVCITLQVSPGGPLRAEVADPRWGTTHVGEGRWARDVGQVFI